jgi:replicative DNA helicase
MGKSTMLINICSHAAKNDKHVYFASLEMPKERVIDKIASDFGKVPYQNIKTGDMQDCEFATMAHGLGLLSNKNFIIDDTPAQDITKLRIKLKKMAARKPLDLIAIDYLQLLKDNKTKNRFDEISEISRQLKELSKTLNCPIIALSQLNRGVENRQDKRPSTADLRESGQIEQDADLIAFLYRDEVYYQEWEGNKGVAELIISKARFGTLGTHLLGTELQYSRFTNATDGIKAGYRRYEKPSNQGGFNG